MITAPGSVRSRLAFLLLPIAVALFALADLGLCYEPFVFQYFGLLALLPICLLALPRVAIVDGILQRVLVLASLSLVFMAVNHLCQPQLPDIAWWRLLERGAALGVLIVVACGGAAPGDLIRALGAAAAVTVITIALIAAYLAGTGTAQGDVFFYGLGQVSILGNCCGPALIAWLVWSLRRGSGSDRLGDRLLLACGWLALAAVAVVGSRRGMLAAGAAVVAILALEWLWRRQRAWALALASTLVGAAAVLAALIVLYPGVATMDMRVHIFRAAIEIGGAHPWFGLGHHGSFAIQDADGEHCRHVTALGARLLHAHNEFLDALVDGGVVGLSICLALVVAVIWRVLHIRDGVQRSTCLALGTAILVHALTDNCYGTLVGHLWCASAVGLMLAMPTKGRPWRAWPALATARPLLWVLTGVSTLGAALLSRHAFVAADAGGGEHLRAARYAYEAQAFLSHVSTALSASVLGHAPRPSDAFTALARQRLGTDACFVQQRLALADPRREPRPFAADLVLAIRQFPFVPLFYRDLDRLLSEHPGLAAEVPARLRERLAMLRTAAPGPISGLSAPRDIETAADRFVLLARALDERHPPKEMAGPLRDLVEHYGDLNGVTELAICAFLRADDGSMDWLLAHQRALRRGCAFSADLPRLLVGIASADDARRALPLLVRIYPDWAADGAAVRPGIGAFTDDRDRILQIQVMRIAALAAAAERRERASAPAR